MLFEETSMIASSVGSYSAEGVGAYLLAVASCCGCLLIVWHHDVAGVGVMGE